MSTHFRCAPRAAATDHRAALMALAKRRLEAGDWRDGGRIDLVWALHLHGIHFQVARVKSLLGSRSIFRAWVISRSFQGNIIELPD